MYLLKADVKLPALGNLKLALSFTWYVRDAVMISD